MRWILSALECFRSKVKCNRKDPICFSPFLYGERNLVERFFGKIKHCRRVATRYDKLACIRLWLRVYEFSAQFE